MSKEARFLPQTATVWGVGCSNRRNEKGFLFWRTTPELVFRRFVNQIGSFFLRNVAKISFWRSVSISQRKNGERVVFSIARALIVVATLISVLATASFANAATYRTANFVVDAQTDELARKIGNAAERLRADLAILWLGQVLPDWYNPCFVTVKAGENLGAGGETVYTVADGQVFDWKMTIQGSETRLLDSVLPHEITHTIVASYLRKPAPRWIDEGIATSVEANVERTNYRTMLATFLHSKKGIAFNDMVAMKEYPADLMPFYSQSFSVCEYLISVGGRRRLVEFAKYGSETNDWNAALRRYYECDSLGALQLEWVDWIARWDSANRPSSLPATRKLRDFSDWEREETALANVDRRENSNGNGVALASATVPARQTVDATAPKNERGASIRSWGRSEVGATAIRAQDKTAKNASEGDDLESFRPKALPTVPRPSRRTGSAIEVGEPTVGKLDSVRAEPLIQTSQGGVKWRSVDCLADGAGSATRKPSEKR